MSTPLPAIGGQADDGLTRRVLQVIHACSHAGRPHWESMLRHALQTHPAVFATAGFAARYREMAADADRFADSLVANACLEGYGARQILGFADRISHPGHAEKIRQHALDESRHATVFIFMLELVFPGLLAAQDADIRTQIRDMQPFLNANELRCRQPADTDSCLAPADALDEIMQVHITEIRALVLQDLVREALLRHAPHGNVERLLRISDRLIADEARHIGYCADIIEDAARENPQEAARLHESFAIHLRNFNDLTREELERQAIEL